MPTSGETFPIVFTYTGANYTVGPTTRQNDAGESPSREDLRPFEVIRPYRGAAILPTTSTPGPLPGVGLSTTISFNSRSRAVAFGFMSGTRAHELSAGPGPDPFHAHAVVAEGLAKRLGLLAPYFIQVPLRLAIT